MTSLLESLFKYFMFILTLVVWDHQIETWDDGKHVQQQVVSCAVPLTDAELKIFSTRSHPTMPEYDRRLEIHDPGQGVEEHEITGDTTGANIIDVYVRAEHPNLRFYLTSPRFFEMDKRHGGPQDVVYPGVEDAAGNSGQPEFRTQKFWVLHEGTVPLSGDSSGYVDLTHIGHFDTHRNTWKTEPAPTQSGAD